MIIEREVRKGNRKKTLLYPTMNLIGSNFLFDFSAQWRKKIKKIHFSYSTYICVKKLDLILTLKLKYFQVTILCYILVVWFFLLNNTVIKKIFSAENNYVLLLRYSKRVLPSLPWNIIINHFLENRGRAALLAKC